MINKTKKYKLYASLALVILGVLLTVFLLSGGNLDLLKSIFIEKHTDEELRDKIADFGPRGYITVSIMAMLQVIFTFLPAEPVQVLAGLAFGFPIGLLCCMVGVVVGNSMIYVLYRAYGDGIREYFLKNLKLDLDRVSRSKRLALIIFALYFLPAIPYGMICFFAASAGMKYRRFMIVTLIGTVPSVCIGVGLGNMALMSSWTVSLAVFIVIAVMLSVVLIKRNAIFAKINAYAEKTQKAPAGAVKRSNHISFSIAYFFAKAYFTLCGIRIRSHSKINGNIQSPSIVLCNHGSFIDFIYAGGMIRKSLPHFIVARLYFYHNVLGWLLRHLGCFPKSMFATDLDSAKNCLRVLRSGEVLAMMPEARLSTVGKYEDIQESTFAFLKNAKVPVYTIKIQGDYFADPKWGHGFRRGSLVEAELDILFTKEEIAALSVDAIKARTEDRIRYDEFEWLKARPSIHYHSKKLAEGLENVLITCPRCKQKYKLTTKGHDVFCENCGKLTSIDDRYAFDPDFEYENFAVWYEDEKRKLTDKILSDDSYSLTSKVTFRLRSQDGKSLLRLAGQGKCTLDRRGLTYIGSRDGEASELFFPMDKIYRLLFGAGQNFEIYIGSEIYFFEPEDKRSAVEWYLASMILKDEAMLKASRLAHDTANV